MKTIDTMTDEQLDVLGARLAEIFNLRKDSEHRDRWNVEGGNKTNIGLARTFARIVDEVEQGISPHKLFH